VLSIRSTGAPILFEATLDLSGDASHAIGSNPFFLTRDARIPLWPARRGLLSVDAAWLRWTGPMRLMQPIRRFPLACNVPVTPLIHSPRGEDLILQFRDALHGVKAQRDTGGGAEFESVREYQPGLDSRFIDWKRSARHHKMLVREFHAERNHPVVLAFDTGHLMREPLDGVPRLDAGITAGLLLARAALEADDLVGSYSFDSRPGHFLPPARGIQSFRRLQQTAASLAYSSDETNFTLAMADLHARLRRRSLIVLFTDFTDTITAELLIENVRRIATRHLLVFVSLRDPVLPEIFEARPASEALLARSVVAGDFLRERSIVLERLERLGIQCIDVPASQLSAALLNRYLHIKQRGLL